VTHVFIVDQENNLEYFVFDPLHHFVDSDILEVFVDVVDCHEKGGNEEEILVILHRLGKILVFDCIDDICCNERNHVGLDQDGYQGQDNESDYFPFFFIEEFFE
jgi:hypothetical protein